MHYFLNGVALVLLSKSMQSNLLPNYLPRIEHWNVGNAKKRSLPYATIVVWKPSERVFNYQICCINIQASWATKQACICYYLHEDCVVACSLSSCLETSKVCKTSTILRRIMVILAMLDELAPVCVRWSGVLASVCPWLAASVALFYHINSERIWRQLWQLGKLRVLETVVDRVGKSWIARQSGTQDGLMSSLARI